MRTRSEWVQRNIKWLKAQGGTSHDGLFRDEVPAAVQIRPAIDSQVLDDWQLQDLCMCPVGGTVTTAASATSGYFQINGKHPTLIKRGRKNEARIQQDPGGFHYLWIEWVMFDDTAPMGIGPCALLRAAEAAARLGLREIRLTAGGGHGQKLALKGKVWNEPMIGYYVWARFGFDAPLEPVMLQETVKHSNLAHCQSVLDIIDADPTWWNDHGDGCEMTFDLSENSRSWQTLQHYLQQKGLVR